MEIGGERQDSVVLSVASAPVRNPIITAFQQDNQPSHKTQQPDNETNCWPMPVIDVHRRAQTERSCRQIEVGQAFVDWF